MKHIVYILFLAILVASCDSEKKEEKNKTQVKQVEEKILISKIGISLTDRAKLKVAGWQEFELLSNKLKRYYRVTKTEALYNAPALVEIIESASDTIDVKELDRPDVRIRFNVIKNHAMRLSDMYSISSITEDEVLFEVSSMLDAYSALKDKINVICKIERYREELGIVYDENEEEKIEKVEEYQVQRPGRGMFMSSSFSSPGLSQIQDTIAIDSLK